MQEENQQPAPVTKKSIKPLLVSLLILLTIALIAGAYILGNKSVQNSVSDVSGSQTQQEKKQSGSMVQNYKKLVSDQKGFPINDINDNSGNLKLHLLDSKRTVTVDKVKIAGGGGSSGLGSSSPIASPDLAYTAYISDDKNLWLISHSSQESRQLTKNGYVEYITDWSPDSKKLVYYFQRDTLAGRTEGMGANPTVVNFKTQPEVGFYQIDIETGVTTPLAALEYVESFIDNDRLLVKVRPEDTNYAIFNTRMMEGDYAQPKGTFGFGTGQFDFARTGKQWAYTTSRNVGNDMQVAISDFPQGSVKNIDTGKWADFQFPQFSPDGTKVAYWKRVGQLGEGVPYYTVWVYDIAGNTKANYGNGQLVRWIDDKTVLVRKVDSSGLLVNFGLLDLPSKNVTDLE